MSADNRKVSTDALETLGTIIGPDEKRDAIHLAVIPCIAPQSMHPGSPVTANGRLTSHKDAVGIVDPFLPDIVKKGQRFWLVIMPRKITSLRHVWSHPAFPEEAEVKPVLDKRQLAEAWLREHAEHLGLAYSELLRLAEVWLDGNDWDGYYIQQGSSRMRDSFNPKEFWAHWETLTDRKAPDDKRQSFFSCSC